MLTSKVRRCRKQEEQRCVFTTLQPAAAYAVTNWSALFRSFPRDFTVLKNDKRRTDMMRLGLQQDRQCSYRSELVIVWRELIQPVRLNHRDVSNGILHRFRENHPQMVRIVQNRFRFRRGWKRKTLTIIYTSICAVRSECIKFSHNG